MAMTLLTEEKEKRDKAEKGDGAEEKEGKKAKYEKDEKEEKAEKPDEKAEKEEKAEKPEKADKAKAEKSEKPEKHEKKDKDEKEEKPGKAEKKDDIAGKQVLRIEGFVKDTEEREVEELPGKLCVHANVAYSKKTDSYTVGDERLMQRICKAVNMMIEDGVKDAVGAKRVEYSYNTAGLITGFRLKG